MFAGASPPEEPKALVQKVQELAQKATDMAKDAFSRVRDSEAAQQARCLRTPPALSLSPSLSLFPGAGGEPVLTLSRPLPVQAVAVGQRGVGEAAAGVAQGKAGRALEEDSGPVASPGTARELLGLGTPPAPSRCRGALNKAGLTQTLWWRHWLGRGGVARRRSVTRREREGWDRHQH